MRLSTASKDIASLSNNRQSSHKNGKLEITLHIKGIFHRQRVELTLKLCCDSLDYMALQASPPTHLMSFSQGHSSSAG